LRQWLLEHGVSIDAKTAQGHIALRYVAEAGHDLVCQHLLEAGADSRIRARYIGSTPLHHAAGSGHLQVVKTLLNFEYDLFVRDAWGHTPLHTAAFAGSVEVVEKILEAVPAKNSPVIDTDSSVISAGEVLVPDENAKFEEVLLERRSYINLQNTYGETALMHAVKRGHVGVLAALLREGGDLKLANSRGNLPIHTAAAVNHTAMLTLLLAQSAPMVDAFNKHGNTALHLAAENSKITTLQAILELTPDLTIVNHCFMTALDIVQAHQNGRWELCQDLLMKARAEASNRGPVQQQVLDEPLLRTLNQIKGRLIDNQDLYSVLLGILEGNSRQAIISSKVVKQISTLLQRDVDQLRGIIKLLPPGSIL
jgi:ankyrin repeat protein